MQYKLRFTPTADKQLTDLENNHSLEGVLQQVRKTLGYLETNLRSKSLQTHEYYSLTNRYGQKISEAYVQQNSPAAYRVFWHYGSDAVDQDGKRVAVITIIAITPHP